MKDRKHCTIRTLSGLLGMLFAALFSASIAATNTRALPAFAHAVPAAAQR